MTEQPDWETVRSFEAVASHRTVRAAGIALSVHHSTISRRIEALERNMGSRLFERHPDGLMLTAAGEALLNTAKRFKEELTATTRAITGLDDELAGTLTVTMSQPMAEVVFGPRLLEFQTLYPQLEICLHVTDSFLDVSRRQADVAIRMDNNPPDTLVGKRLFRYAQSIYASRPYVAAHDPQRYPERARWLGWDDGSSRCPEWAQTTEFANTPTWGQFPQLAMQITAARHGLGIAMLPCMLGDTDPLLQRITNSAPIPSRDIWVLMHSDLRKTARVRAFTAFAEDLLRGRRSLIEGLEPAQ